MDYQDLHIPVETLEHIIDLIPDSTHLDDRWQSGHKRTLFICALVCKTWTLIARRLLISQYFSTGAVKIKRDTRDVFSLIDIFQPPFCTLDPAFIKLLHFTPYLFTKQAPGEQPNYLNAGLEPQSFHTALSILDATVFSSLRAFKFDNGSWPPPRMDIGDGVKISPLSVLLQINTLAFRVFHSHLFYDIVHIIRICPSVQEVTAFVEDSSYRVSDPRLYDLHPPKSLRHLILDMQALVEITEWMMTRQPNYTTISSLVIYGFSWNGYIDSASLQKFLDGLGTNLEKLVLQVPGSMRAGTTVHHPDSLLKQLTKNTSLKRFALWTTQGAALDILPYLLKHSHFAPRLQTLEVVVPCWELSTALRSEKLALVDQLIQSRLFLKQIIISCDWGTWPEDWRETEKHTRKSLPYCEGKGVLEFRLHSQDYTRTLQTTTHTENLCL